VKDLKLTNDQWTMLARCEAAAIVEPGGYKVTTAYAQAVIRAGAPPVKPARKKPTLDRLEHLALVQRRVGGPSYRPTQLGREVLAARLGAP
jgi:hypothetical protein